MCIPYAYRAFCSARPTRRGCRLGRLVLPAALMVAFAIAPGPAVAQLRGQQRGPVPRVVAPPRGIGKLPIKPSAAENTTPRVAAPARGIDKRDLRVVIACWDPDAREADVLARALRPTIHAIAAQANRTAADPRGSIFIKVERSSRFAEWLDRMFSHTGEAGVLVLSAAKQNGENCDKPGCVPSDLGCFCFRLLDFDKTILSDLPGNDPGSPVDPRDHLGGSNGSTGSTGGSGGRLAGAPKPRWLIVVLNAEKRNPAEMREFVRQVVTSTLRSPPAERLVIKTKSSPP